MRNSLILIGLTFRTFSAWSRIAFPHVAWPTRSPVTRPARSRGDREGRTHAGTRRTGAANVTGRSGPSIPRAR